ncbi:MAG TPA: N,N-dimethylformamidase beta subunit family domain-containing protein [Verrucomicrobiae bacterium]|nr:N,N-dimethylformamidase beta subunit family domain-containing protein [Verrucomicrobiae bacterium]
MKAKSRAPLSRASNTSPGSDAMTRRDLLKGVAGLGAAAALSGCSLASGSRGAGMNAFKSQPDLIRRENQRAGTRDWMLTRSQIDPKTKYRCPWIEGYCSQTSLRARDSIKFFVSTNPSSPFTLSIYRLGYYGGAGGRHMLTIGPFEGTTQNDPPVGPKRLRDCQWDSCYELTIPDDWVSGVYLGKLTALRNGFQSHVIFVVRDDRPADFIVQCSDNTWQAYNRWPNQFALYDDGNSEWYWGDKVQVGFNRPYGKYCQAFNDYTLTTGSGEFLLFEFPLTYWLEQHGHDVTYISNLDTHTDYNGLLRAKGFLSVGHDEYWSIEMFNHMREAIAAGLNVAFLSGNTCCGRILHSPDTGGVGNRVFERVDVFSPPEPPEPFVAMAKLPHKSPNANLLIGARSIPPVTGGADWTCALPEHWIFAGTGMQKGDSIKGIVGWEWHGDPARLDGLEIVATGLTYSKPGQPNGGTYTATTYPGPKGNFVFNAATIWWSDGLAEPPGYKRPTAYTTPPGPDPRVQRITENILKRMQASARPLGA